MSGLRYRDRQMGTGGRSSTRYLKFLIGDPVDAPSSAACPPSCGFTMKVNVSTTTPPAIAQEAIPLEIPWLPPIPFLPTWLTQDPTQTLMKSMKWSKFPGCSVQYQNDIAVCQQRKTSSCWSSAAERLSHCNATGGSVGWPPLAK
jgi:hypothetical protein